MRLWRAKTIYRYYQTVDPNKAQENTEASTKQFALGKWTRRGFISAGALASGGLIVGVALRRGDRRDQVAELVADDSDTLLSMWVKIDEAGKITAIVPHS